MRLHILSDIHLEFGKWPKSIDVNAIDADVTVLAGDIGVGLQGIQWALSIERPVVYVMGNHEFYGQRAMDELWRKAKERVRGTHVHLLENEAVLMDTPGRPQEPVRFIGATLWTDFCLLGAYQVRRMMEFAQYHLNDFQTILTTGRRSSSLHAHGGGRKKGSLLTARRTFELHCASRIFIESELDRMPCLASGALHSVKTVVVTHHAPSEASLAKQHAWPLLNPAYASNLDHLVCKADLWIHGHTHTAADYRIGSCRVVSNPRGYAGREEVREFNPMMVVEI